MYALMSFGIIFVCVLVGLTLASIFSSSLKKAFFSSTPKMSLWQKLKTKGERFLTKEARQNEQSEATLQKNEMQNLESTPAPLQMSALELKGKGAKGEFSPLKEINLRLSNGKKILIFEDNVGNIHIRSVGRGYALLKESKNLRDLLSSKEKSC